MLTNLHPATVDLFEAELANESQGGANPATVASSLDSFEQCPDAFAIDDDTESAIRADLDRLMATDPDAEISDLI